MIFTIFGAAAGLLIIIADMKYVRDTYKGTTRPHRITWFIILLLNIIAFANQYASGATNSLLLIIGGIIATCMVFVASIQRGVGGYEKLDIISLIGALLGLLLWWYFDSPIFSIAASVVVASLALAPTYKKAYLHPESETKLTWLLGTISAIFGAISVGGLEYVLLILPVFGIIANAGMYIILQYRGKNYR